MIIRINFKKYSRLNTFQVRSFLRLLVIVWLSRKYFDRLKIKLYRNASYSKFHPLVKGPKCHKRGKDILKYTFSQTYIIINYYIDKELEVKHSYAYFIFMNDIFKNFSTSTYYQHRFDFINKVNCFFIKYMCYQYYY